MLNSQQNNGTKVSDKYVHTRNITPHTLKSFLKSVGRFTRNALQNKKAVGLADRQIKYIILQQILVWCIIILILPYIIHINNH